MAKRFSSTEIWSEDWFLDMEPNYKLFWHYMLASCNHAGLFKVNVKVFNSINGVNIAPSKALEYFNAGKNRVRQISDTLWLIEDFFAFQYGGTFNPKNRVHESIAKEYHKSGIDIKSIRGVGSPLLDPNNGVKDKDKDKDTNTKVIVPIVEDIQDATEILINPLPLPTTPLPPLAATPIGDGLHPIIISPNRPKDAPTVEQVSLVFASLNAPERMRKFFEHYEANGWTDGFGRSMILYWPSKASKWVSDDIAKEQKAQAKADETARLKAEKDKPKTPASSGTSYEDIMRQRYPERYQNT